MKNDTAHKMLAAGVALVLFTACGGPSTASSTPQVPQGSSLTGADATSSNLSGEYAGKIKDNMHGTGNASAKLSQSKNSLGGSLSIAGNPTVEYISWITSRGAVDGKSVFVASSGYCTFSHVGTYNSKTRTLIGSYKALYGCSGEKGTYTLTHRCYYKGTAESDVRPETGLRPC